MSESPALWHEVLDDQYAAVVMPKDMNYGTLHILHIPSKSYVHSEDVTLGLGPMGVFFGQGNSEDDWSRLAHLWVATNAAEESDHQ